MFSEWASPDTRMTKILEALADGKWHAKRELLEETGLGHGHLDMILGFLAAYGFITVDAAGGKVRLDENFRRLLLQEISQ
ncbi:MAG: hypothetical protein QXU46_01035 [Candidatus Bathyarchaeia archaeon]